MLALRHSLRRGAQISTRSVAIPAAELEAQKTGDYTNLDRVQDWQNFKMPFAPYEGMGPKPPTPLPNETLPEEAQTRMLMLPESYFKMMESKLGYSGGYTLFWGSALFLTSKELIVCGPDMPWAIAAYIILGNIMQKGFLPWIDRETDIQILSEEKRVQDWKEYKMSLVESEVDGIARLKEQASGLALVQEQRKNNLAMALEAEFLNRQADLTEAVKKRLDYQVAVKNAEREAMSKHMISWIESEVSSAISKRNAGNDLNAAIAQLKSMAK